jgi:4-hydroxybenzoate polyprenyltransferase
MPTSKQRVLALLATSRAANLPTVATHVMVGFLLAVDSLGFGEWPWQVARFATIATWQDALFATIAIVLGCVYYIGGCLLGDAVDAQFDATHRPERPIPKGILSARAIAVTGTLHLAAAWLISCLLPLIIALVIFEVPAAKVLPALFSGALFDAFPWQYIAICSGLASAITSYAKFHKRLGALAPVLMAICRALLVIWAASIVMTVEGVYTNSFHLPTTVLIYAGATFLYTFTLSLVARNESDPDAKLPGWSLKLLFVLPPILLPWRIINSGDTDSAQVHLHLIIASLIFLAWCLCAFTRLRHSIPAFVSCALAGFCLMDACFAVLVGWPVALACLALFLLALLLQRIAPAT